MKTLPGEKIANQLKWQKRHKKLTKHHNVAQHFGGRGNGHKGEDDYISMLTPEHHALFHKLFGLRTFKQAAQLLLRLDRMASA